MSPIPPVPDQTSMHISSRPPSSTGMASLKSGLLTNVSPSIPNLSLILPLSTASHPPTSVRSAAPSSLLTSPSLNYILLGWFMLLSLNPTCSRAAVPGPASPTVTKAGSPSTLLTTTQTPTRAPTLALVTRISPHSLVTSCLTQKLRSSASTHHSSILGVHTHSLPSMQKTTMQ